MSFRILHTADWHLGKTFFHVSLEEDQIHFLSQIKQELLSKTYDALVVSGDVFDKEQPRPSDYQLLENFIRDIHEDIPGLPLFFITGNHDSSIMGFTRSLIKDKNVFITVDTKNLTEPVLLVDKSDESKKLAVYQLPFLKPYSLFSDDSLFSQEEMLSKAVSDILKNHEEKYSGIPTLLSAHLSTIGKGEKSEDHESISGYDETTVANVAAVSPSLFEGFTYTALGHIHKSMPANSKHNIYYSGSPLLYYFDASPETYMLEVIIGGDDGDASGDGTNLCVNKISFAPLHPAIRITDYVAKYLMENATNDLIEKYKDCYLEFVYKDSVLPENARSSIKKNFRVLKFTPQETTVQQEANSIIAKRSALIKKNNVKPEELFDTFFNENYKLNEEQKELHQEARQQFAAIWEECLK